VTSGILRRFFNTNDMAEKIVTILASAGLMATVVVNDRRAKDELYGKIEKKGYHFRPQLQPWIFSITRICLYILRDLTYDALTTKDRKSRLTIVSFYNRTFVVSPDNRSLCLRTNCNIFSMRK